MSEFYLRDNAWMMHDNKPVMVFITAKRTEESFNGSLGNKITRRSYNCREFTFNIGRSDGYYPLFKSKEELIKSL